jgi:hypothetical protein
MPYEDHGVCVCTVVMNPAPLLSLSSGRTTGMHFKARANPPMSFLWKDFAAVIQLTCLSEIFKSQRPWDILKSHCIADF